MASRLRPIPGSAGLSVVPGGDQAPFVVIADLHLGLGASPLAPQGPPGASAAELAARAVRCCRDAGVRRLVVAGDVKHPIVGVPPWLRPVVFDFFGALLAEEIVPEVVLGNHDVDLVRHLPREVVVHPSLGVAVGSVGIFHGHRWPGEEVLRSPALVAGHLHPGVRFAPTADAPDGKVRAWLRVQYTAGHGVRRRDGRVARVRELVVVPAFHPLAGTEALNRERPERGRSFLYARFLAPGRTRAYLLDGTDVGAIPSPAPPAPVAAVRPAPPAPRSGARSLTRSRRAPWPRRRRARAAPRRG
jgi:uncharacterized protein